MLSKQAAAQQIGCFRRIVHKLCSWFLGEMMSLRANNNNNSAHFLSCLHPALGSIFPSAFAKPAQTRCSHIYTQTKKNHTQTLCRKWQWRDVMHLRLMVARSIKLFGYFKKMTEEARRQPRAAPRLQRCVYLESYSCGEGKEQQSSNRATEPLFLVLFAVGSFETPSLLARDKEQQREKTNGTGPG